MLSVARTVRLKPLLPSRIRLLVWWFLRCRLLNGPVRVVGHQQVEILLAQDLLLVLQGLVDAGDEVVQMLEAEGGGDQIPHEGFGKPQGVAGQIVGFPERAVFGQQVGLADLGDDDGEVVLVDVGVIGVDDVLHPLGEAPEDVEVLGVGEALDVEASWSGATCRFPAAGW